jgi:hypothetical protein
MSLAKPFYRTYRPNLQDSHNLYMHDSRYIEHPSGLLSAIQVLYKDFERLFEYVEPNDDNKNSYSLRTYELLIRTCIEIESQFKSIMYSNGYQNPKCMHDYYKVNFTHHLSDYEVLMPIWAGQEHLRRPFFCWRGDSYSQLSWYKAYNDVKHSRENNFPLASLYNTTDALCGLLVLLAAQFCDHNFAETEIGCALGFSPLTDGYSSTIGTPFRIKFPDNWTEDEKYDFKWNDIKTQSDPYESLTFN